MDIATMKTPGKNKTAGTKAALAKGHALATTCIAYAVKRMEEEDKQIGKLNLIVKSIGDLDHKGHVEFRAELTRELILLKELRTAVGTTKAQTAGYSFNSFEVLVSNWRTISTACELGYKPEGKPWSTVLAESVQIKNGHAMGQGEAHGPTKRKVGRKATPLIDKAMTAAKALDKGDFVKFAAWVQSELAIRTAKKPSAIKQAVPA